MKSFIRLLAASFALAAIVAAPNSAAGQQAGAIVVEDPWVATTNPGATVAGGYVTLRNNGAQADRLLSAESPRARLQLHEMSMDGGMMQMREVAGIDIPAGGAATLAPGGYHIMFLDLTAPITNGERIPVTLHFAHQGAVQVVFVARPRNGRSGHEH